MEISTLEALARRHHGAVDRRLAGCSRAAWSRAHASGLLIALHPNVSRLAGTFETPELRIAAAVLATGPGALASHRSAIHLWGIPRPMDDPVDVILPQRGPQRHFTGVEVHRPRDQLRLRPPQRRAGIPCTNVVRALCDLGAVDRGAVRGAVGHALATRLVALTALQAAVLDTNVLIECDGWTHHGLDPVQFERDRRRDAELSAAGWIVLRFTYRSIIQEPSATARRIREAVDRWAA